MITIQLLNADDDLTDLISLSQDFFREYEAYHADFFKIAEINAEHVISYFSSFCGHSTRKAFIAVDSGRVVGYITVHIDERPDYWQITRTGEISGLMVQKEYRHMGIGKELLGKAREFLKHQNITYYTLYTSVANQGALDFYRKTGMAPLYTTMIGEV